MAVAISVPVEEGYGKRPPPRNAGPAKSCWVGNLLDGANDWWLVAGRSMIKRGETWPVSCPRRDLLLVTSEGANQDAEELASQCVSPASATGSAPQAADWLPQRRVRRSAAFWIMGLA